MTDTLTFPGIDPTAALDGALWGFAGQQRQQCVSRFYGHPQARGVLWCCVDHAETRAKAHGTMIGPHFFPWTDAEAAGSLPGRECLGCDRPIKGEDFYGYCSPTCRWVHRFADDERGVEA